MAESDFQERTEQPTAKRLREARGKGQVARSRELGTMLVMMAGALALYALGAEIATHLSMQLREAFSWERREMFDPAFMPQALGQAVAAALLAIAPLLATCVVAALLGPLLLGGWNFAAKALRPQLSKLNPIKGFARLFSARSLVELLKAMAKFVLIGTFAVLLLRNRATELLSLGFEPVDGGLAHALALCGLALISLSAVLVLIAAIDVPFQLWDHNRKLKMTRQEVRDEHKDTEGKPEVKSRIRQVQQQMARQRMMQEVPKADVVVTNPTHFAVALRYDQDNMRAPRVVAKGADLLAGRIRELAREHEVPLFEAPPLARVLYREVEIGDEVPSRLYLAVATVLSYIYALRLARTGDGPVPPRPSLELAADIESEHGDDLNDAD